MENNKELVERAERAASQLHKKHPEHIYTKGIRQLINYLKEAPDHTPSLNALRQLTENMEFIVGESTC